ncbi:hypothetical protein ACSSV4_000597 [Roseovarius sp. MBR-154]|jgi:hypothetical protein
MLKGKDGVVKFGTPVAAVLAVQSWNLDPQADEVSGWGMGDEWEESFATIKRYSGSVEVYLNPADAAVPDLAETVAVELFPGGETTGSGFFSGNVVITGKAMSGSKDGIPTMTLNIKGTGALTESTVV